MKTRATISVKVLHLGLLILSSLFLCWPVQAQLFPPSDVALDPSNGGRSISLTALKQGDVIVSTTSQTVSSAIRVITQSPVSHAVIYIGNNSVIEAVEEGVTIKPIEEMLNGASLAVAFRYANLTSAQAATINDFAFAQLGKRFNVLGILRHPRFSILPENCNAYSGKLKEACTNWRGLILLAVAIKTGDTEFSGKDEFFCSQLVAEAYKKAGIDLFRVTSSTTTPGDIPVLAQVGDLRYVGHLKR